MSMSNIVENKVLKALLQGTDIDFRASANLYLALFTADPTESGSFTNEANYTGYARVMMPKTTAWKMEVAHLPMLLYCSFHNVLVVIIL